MIQSFEILGPDILEDVVGARLRRSVVTGRPVGHFGVLLTRRGLGRLLGLGSRLGALVRRGWALADSGPGRRSLLGRSRRGLTLLLPLGH